MICLTSSQIFNRFLGIFKQTSEEIIIFYYKKMSSKSQLKLNFKIPKLATIPKQRISPIEGTFNLFIHYKNYFSISCFAKSLDRPRKTN